jgi:hypothetical protein
MQLFNGLTVDEVVERQTTLFQRLHVAIEPYSQEDNCYVNCMLKRDKNGGEVVVGWRRDRAIVDGPEIISTLTHHSVWKPLDGNAIDITPQRRLFNGVWEILIPNYVDFMPDPSATFDDIEHPRSPITIPSAPDTFGYLKEACNRMDKRWALQVAGEAAKAADEGREIGRLLRAHIARSQEDQDRERVST